MPGACGVLLSWPMRHIRALMLPPVAFGGMTCLAGLPGNLTLCYLLMLMLVWVLLCLPVSVVEACANRRTVVRLYSTAPWWSSVCVFLPHSGLLIFRPSLGLPLLGHLTALTMLLYHAPGTCGAQERSCHMVAPREALDIDGSCSVHVVDSAGDWEDHFLVALRAPLVIRWAPRSTQWRVEGVDRAALRGLVCCSKFKCA